MLTFYLTVYQSIWHLFWHNILYILSGIYSYSLSGNHSSILSDMSCNLSGILSDDILAFCLAFFYLAFCLASSLAWVRVQAHSTVSLVSRACSTVKEEGIRRKEESIETLTWQVRNKASTNQIPRPGYFHSSVAFVGSVHHFGWSRDFWDIPGI